MLVATYVLPHVTQWPPVKQATMVGCGGLPISRELLSLEALRLRVNRVGTFDGHSSKQAMVELSSVCWWATRRRCSSRASSWLVDAVSNSMPSSE